MTGSHLILKPWAKHLSVFTGATCALAVLPALLPAGYAIFMLEHPGAGLLHDLYVWFTMAVLILMPVIALLGVFIPWRMFKRGQYAKTVTWCVATLALLGYWSVWAYTLYFT